MGLFKRSKRSKNSTPAGEIHIHTVQGDQVARGLLTTADLRADDIVIAVMGPTGSGKSTFIRSASGQKPDGKGHGLRSSTDQVSAIRFSDQGRHIVLVDTPGFNDTYKPDHHILRMISNWLVSSYNRGKLLTGILYLHRITDNRMAGSPLKNLDVFRSLCGKNALNKVFLVTTMWDEVEPSVGERRLNELKAKYWKSMINQGAQIARCRSDDDSAKRLLCHMVLFDKSRENDVSRSEIPAAHASVYSLDEEESPDTFSQILGGPSMKTQSLDKKDPEPKPDDIIIAVIGSSGFKENAFIRSACECDTLQEHNTHSEVSVSQPVSVAPQETSGSITAHTRPTSNVLETQRGSCVLEALHTSNAPGSHRTEPQPIPTGFLDEMSGRYIVLVEIPGLDDLRMADHDIANAMHKWLVSSYNPKKFFSAIIYLHPITADSAMPIDPKAFRKLLAKDVSDRLYLTTTMWDTIDPVIGERKIEELKSTHWKKLISEGARVGRCRSDDDSAKTLIRHIVAEEYNSGKRLLIQEEMVEMKKALKETAAGQKIYSQLEMMVEKQMELLRKIGKERKTATNEDILKDLQDEYDDLRTQIDERMRQMEELKLPLIKRIFSFIRG